MIYKAIAAILLLPASLELHGRRWPGLFRAAPGRFFRHVLKVGPAFVRKRGLLHGLFVYYPMRAAALLLERRSLKSVLRRAARLCLRYLYRKAGGFAEPDCPLANPASLPVPPPLPHFSAHALQAMALDPDVRIVSFSVFDTLLSLPVINDADEIFHLVASRVDRKYNLDFARLRQAAAKCRHDGAGLTLERIYARIERERGGAVASALREEELRCLAALLRPSPGMFELCRVAAGSGRRVIALGRTCLPRSFLLDILHKNGFADIARIYAFPECRPAENSLFAELLKAEDCQPEALLHFGGDARGIAMALDLGMRAVLVPSTRQILLEHGGEMAKVLRGLARRDPLWGILEAFALESLPASRGDWSLDRCPDIASLARLVIAPLVAAIVLKLMDFQDQGWQICYPGPDAWLPGQVHACLARVLGRPGAVHDNAAVPPDDSKGFLIFSVDSSAPLPDAFWRPGAARICCWHAGRPVENIMPPLMGNEAAKPWAALLSALFSASSEKSAIIAAECLAYAGALAERFGEYARCLGNADPSCSLDVLRQLFQKNPLDNRGILSGIGAGSANADACTLEELLDRGLPHKNIFTATGFSDKANQIALASLCRPAPPGGLGIHVHIYNRALAQIFARYLVLFPFSFDLFVTCAHGRDAPALRALFNNRVLEKAGRVAIIPTPNRGRDVAPWLAGVGGIQKEYALFCHVHSKESAHLDPGVGESWRSYLLDNLLRPDAVRAIMTAFQLDEGLGCVFPAIFSAFGGIESDGTLYGPESQGKLVRNLLRRMGLPDACGRGELFFSAGTMFWFRPAALLPLIDCGLAFEDFPEEPVGTDGSIAHAIERIPPLVCARMGYRTRSITCYSET